MAAWLLVTLLISGDLTPQTRTFSHVRADDARIRELVATGYAGSQTLARLVDTIEGLPCIVYIVPVPRLSQGMVGALLNMPAGRPDMPVLRVLVKSNLSRDETIATIAHELQHVVEVMTMTAALGRFDMSAAFDRLDPMTARLTGVRKYETEQAIEVTHTVRDELRKRRD